jgi:hypothetical protein
MEIRIVKHSDIKRCPITSLSPAHYNADGTCHCAEVAAAKAAFTEACARLRRY